MFFLLLRASLPGGPNFYPTTPKTDMFCVCGWVGAWTDGCPVKWEVGLSGASPTIVLHVVGREKQWGWPIWMTSGSGCKIFWSDCVRQCLERLQLWGCLGVSNIVSCGDHLWGAARAVFLCPTPQISFGDFAPPPLFICSWRVFPLLNLYVSSYRLFVYNK